MNDEQFDQELTTLYQQRKSQIVAPTVSLGHKKSKPRSSIIRLSSIFAVGGLASFGIMALITTLAGKPEPKLGNDIIHQVNITEVEIARTTEETVLPKVELPPQPKIARISTSNKSLTPIASSVSVNKPENILMNMPQTITLPLLKEPELSIKPIYKVMPKYPQKALNEDQTGSIKLSYEIDGSGSVTEIQVIDSKVSRLLQRSAKKALAKWKYNPEDNVQSRYEIIFEFNSVK